MLISDKIDFKIKSQEVKKNYIMTKGSIQEEDITIIYAPNIGAPQYIRYKAIAESYKRRNQQQHNNSRAL